MHSCEHSWYGKAFLLSTPGMVVRSQFSRWRSWVGSCNPRKIGMGVPNILRFVKRGCQKMRVPIYYFFVTVGSKWNQVINVLFKSWSRDQDELWATKINRSIYFLRCQGCIGYIHFCPL